MYFYNRRWSVILRRVTEKYRGCVKGVMVMYWRCRGDGIESCGEHIQGGEILRVTTCLVVVEWVHTYGNIAYGSPKRSPMFTRSCCKHRWCAVDVSAAFWTLVYLAECSLTYLRCSALVLATKHWEKIAMHTLHFFSMPDALVKHGDYSRTSPIICRTTAA